MSDEEQIGDERDPNVVTIGELQVRRRRRSYFDAQQACAHKHLEMDEHGQTVQCADCKVYVTPYWALAHLCDELNRGFDRLRAAQQQAAWERKKLVRRVAARRIEQAWNGGMAPCCPHCGRAILPEDGLGTACENRQMELERRGGAS